MKRRINRKVLQLWNESSEERKEYLDQMIGDDGAFRFQITMLAANAQAKCSWYWDKYESVPTVPKLHPKYLWYRLKEWYYRNQFMDWEEIYDMYCEELDAYESR